nr:Ribonuclease H protein [Ipomoea batatas]
MFVDYFKSLFGVSCDRTPCNPTFLNNGPMAVFAIKSTLIAHTGSAHHARLFLLSAFKNNKLHIAMVYDLLRPKFHMAVCWKVTWKPCIPRKFSFIMWLALKNRLATKDRLIMEETESDCSLCVGNKESAHHLFFRCPFVLQVWTRIRDIIGFQKKTIAIRNTIKWIHRLHKGSRRQDHGVAIALACSIYHIWRFRNLVVHEAVGFNLEGLVKCIATDIFRVVFSLSF